MTHSHLTKSHNFEKKTLIKNFYFLTTPCRKIARHWQTLHTNTCQFRSIKIVFTEDRVFAFRHSAMYVLPIEIIAASFHANFPLRLGHIWIKYDVTYIKHIIS
jgi:hypothetical protein